MSKESKLCDRRSIINHQLTIQLATGLVQKQGFQGSMEWRMALKYTGLLDNSIASSFLSFLIEISAVRTSELWFDMSKLYFDSVRWSIVSMHTDRMMTQVEPKNKERAKFPMQTSLLHGQNQKETSLEILLYPYHLPKFFLFHLKIFI